MRRTITPLIAAAMTACAMTPAEVVETPAMATLSLKVGVPRLTDCLLAGLDNLASAWTASQRQDADGLGASVRLHGHNDSGTMAVIRARRLAEETRVSIHVTTSIFPRDNLADKLRDIAASCDKT